MWVHVFPLRPTGATLDTSSVLNELLRHTIACREIKSSLILHCSRTRPTRPLPILIASIQSDIHLGNTPACAPTIVPTHNLVQLTLFPSWRTSLIKSVTSSTARL